MRILRLVVVAVLMACGTTAVQAKGGEEIIQLSPNTYMVTKTSYAGAFANLSKLKSKAIQEANKFAAKQGKVAVPLSSTMSRPSIGGGFPVFEYQFRLADASDIETQRSSAVGRADMILENNQNVTGQIKIRDETPHAPDIYVELTKLDDLRKKGIITDAEFETQKAKILSAN